MSITTPGGSRWPSRLAYAAALIFTLASSGTNLLYGWSKGTDLGTSLVWAAVSFGVSIVFSLSWPAFINSLDQRQWSRAAMVFVALALTGTYSVTAALGSAMGGRQSASLEEQDVADARKKAQKAYTEAETELEGMKGPAERQKIRSVGELEALISGLPSKACKQIVRVGNGLRQTECPPDPRRTTLSAELGRAKRKVELEGKLENASQRLTVVKITKVANSDAVALTAYLNGLGVEVEVDRLNKLLVLLAVLCIECGGGLALAVGMSLQVSGAAVTGGREASGEVSSDEPQMSRKASGELSTSTSNLQPTQSVTLPALPLPASSNRDTAGLHLLALLQKRGGVLIGGQRRMAELLGWSKSWTHRVLHELAESGHVQLNTDSRGTVVRLPTG